MQIQVNTPDGSPSDSFESTVEARVNEVLAPHAQMLTRVEVHVRDTNAHKGGADKRCLIEARPRGLSPLTAEHQSHDSEDAFRGALEKLSRVLDHRIGRLNARERGD